MEVPKNAGDDKVATVSLSLRSSQSIFQALGLVHSYLPLISMGSTSHERSTLPRTSLSFIGLTAYAHRARVRMQLLGLRHELVVA